MKDELQECGDLTSLPNDAIDPPPHPGHWATPNPKDTFVQNQKVSFPPVDAAHGQLGYLAQAVFQLYSLLF